MDLQVVLFLLPYLASAAITLWLGIHAWRRHSVAGAQLFASVAFFEAIWTVSYVLQMIAPDLPGKLVWNNLQFLGAIGAPLAYFGFAIEYEHSAGLSVSRFSWKFLLPIALFFLGFVWTDGLHKMFRGDSYLVSGVPFSRLIFSMGSGYVLYTIYAYSLIVLTTLILISRYLIAPPLYRMQIGIVLFGILIPWVISVITALNLVPVKLHEVTPISFGISNLIIAWALFRYHLFKIVPIARDFLVENMQEGVLVLDSELQIADLNPAAQKILAASRISAIGKEITAFLPLGETWFRDLAKSHSQKTEIILQMDGLPVFYEIQASILRQTRNPAPIFLLILRDIRDRKDFEEKLHILAITDPLTGILNRGHVIFLAQQEIERARRLQHDLSVVLFDVDHFKEINDSYGHMAGDQVLKELARRCQAGMRSMDAFGRYGGEEFLILLPETDASTAAGVAERIRLGIENLFFPGMETNQQVTISMGVASLAGCDTAGLDQLLERADQALYQAKACGRNQVCVYAVK